MTKDLRECQLCSGHFSVCKSTSDSTQPDFHRIIILILCNTITLVLISESALLISFSCFGFYLVNARRTVASQSFFDQQAEAGHTLIWMSGSIFFFCIPKLFCDTEEEKTGKPSQTSLCKIIFKNHKTKFPHVEIFFHSVEFCLRSTEMGVNM